jgi:hypothetical protein
MTVSYSLWMELQVYSYYRVLQKDTRSTQHLNRPWGFRTDKVLGELIYAYVVCGLDIGFAVTFLAFFLLPQLLDTTRP